LRHRLSERVRERRVLRSGRERLDRGFEMAAYGGLPGGTAVGEQQFGQLLAAGLRLTARRRVPRRG